MLVLFFFCCCCSSMFNSQFSWTSPSNIEEAIIHFESSNMHRGSNNTYVNLKFIKCNHLTPIRSEVDLTREREATKGLRCVPKCACVADICLLEIHETIQCALHTKERPFDGCSTLRRNDKKGLFKCDVT